MMITIIIIFGVNNELSINIVNNVLTSLSGTSVYYGQLYLSNQTPPAPPSGDGITAKNHLTNDLIWTVITD